MYMYVLSDGLNHLSIFHKSERETVIERMMQVCVYTYVCVCVYVCMSFCIMKERL